MASATEISNALATALLDNGINALLNEGAGNAIINIYTGAAPADCETAATGTLLATLVMNTTPFGLATDQAPGARVTANSITADTSAPASGTAGYFRAYSSTAGTDASKLNCHIQGSAGEAADTPDLTLDDSEITAGETVSVTSWTIDLAES